jgi:hypothetical protein
VNITPGVPDMIVESSDEVHIVNDRPVLGVNKAVPPETFEEYRLGYRCLACDHGQQPEPFPDNCVEPYCRYPMKTDQLRDLERQDRGTRRYGPTPLSEVDEMFGDERERERFKPRSGIWLPGDKV